jgi:hypothetical protein
MKSQTKLTAALATGLVFLALTACQVGMGPAGTSAAPAQPSETAAPAETATPAPAESAAPAPAETATPAPAETATPAPAAS